VVLPFSLRDRQPAVRRAFDAGVRARQDLVPLLRSRFAGAKLGRG
jgi:hypothetical protein